MLNFLRNWNNKKPSEIDGPPGPSPWYFKHGSGYVTKKATYWWRNEARAERSVALCDASGAPLLLLYMYCYCARIGEGRLLFWHEYSDNGSLQPTGIRFYLIDLDGLRPLKPDEDVPAPTHHEEKRIRLANGAGLLSEFTIPVLPPGMHGVKIPDVLQGIGEVLVLANYDNLNEQERRAIYSIDLTKAIVEVFPQDWFNHADIDFGYQWITRVWRMKDGRIAGDGIRIGPFILDSSFRNLA